MKKLKILSNALLAFALVMSSLPGTTIYGEERTGFSDQFTSTTLQGGGNFISGNHRVWHQSDSQGNRTIYYQDLSTGITQQVTDVSSPKQAPMVTETKNGHVIVLWTDKRNYPDSYGKWDVFSYDLTTGQEKKLNADVGQYYISEAEDNKVLYYSNDSMHIYDLDSDTDMNLGQGRMPKMEAGQVLYQNTSDGGLSLKDVATGEITSVLQLPQDRYVSMYDFNGSDILWLERNLNGEVYYRIMNLEATEPVNLTEPVQRTNVSAFLTVGDGFGAWVEESGGEQRIVGVDLSSGSKNVLANAPSNLKLFQYNNGQLVMNSSDGKMLYRTLYAYEPSQSLQESSTLPPLKADKITKVMGPNGGVIESHDRGFQLNIDKETFEQGTTVDVESISSPSSSGANKITSKVWTLNWSGQANKSVTLSIRYEADKLIPQQLKKLGIYSYNASTSKWMRVGGLTDTSLGVVSAQISNPGTYSILLNDVSYSDIQGHWAQQTIEVLASREVLNGTGSNRFAPNGELTRAQFAKMLVSATGLKPLQLTQSAFADVNSSYWGFAWIEAAAQAGLIQGTEGNFLPDEMLTREQMMVMLMRAVSLHKPADPLNSQEVQQQLNFKDTSAINNWSKQDLAYAVKYGFVQGNKGYLDAQGTSTRSEAATVLFRALLFLGKI